MNIFITGGAGYIGSVLTPLLLQKKHHVTVLDNFMYHQTSLLDVCRDTNLRVIRGDARDATILRREVPKADAIIPLACLTGAPACAKNPQEARGVIIDAIKALLRIRAKNQYLIYPNTNSGYGVGKKDILCTEKSPLKPLTLYGKLKVEAEERILESGNATVFRFATVFGISPRMRLDLLVNDFVHRAVRDRFVVIFEGHFKRNYLHVRDAAGAFLHALNHARTMRDEIYNVGLSDANLSKLDLCEEIKKQVPDFYIAQAPIGQDPDKRDYIVSNAKIEKTGFRPRISLQTGITELIKGYQILHTNSFSNL